jgi:hypothetical protein
MPSLESLQSHFETKSALSQPVKKRKRKPSNDDLESSKKARLEEMDQHKKAAALLREVRAMNRAFFANQKKKYHHPLELIVPNQNDYVNSKTFLPPTGKYVTVNNQRFLGAGDNDDIIHFTYHSIKDGTLHFADGNAVVGNVLVKKIGNEYFLMRDNGKEVQVYYRSALEQQVAVLPDVEMPAAVNCPNEEVNYDPSVVNSLDEEVNYDPFSNFYTDSLLTSHTLYQDSLCYDMETDMDNRFKPL